MSLRSLVLILVLMVLAGYGGFHLARLSRAAVSSVESTEAAIGDPAPPLRLKGLDGSDFDLAAHRGRPVLLNFWASWCPPCVAELPLLDALAARQARDGVLVVGVAVEPEQAARDFLTDTPVDYLNLVGSGGSPDESAPFGNRRGVLPYSVLIDAEGRIVRRQAGAFDEAGLTEFIQP